MPFTDYGAQRAIFRIGSPIVDFIESIEVGYGSGTALVTNVELVNGSVRVIQTGSPNFSTARKVTFQGDFSSSSLSGLQLTEFGLFTSGALDIGSTWAREAFSQVTFDGTNELQVVYTVEAIPG